MKRAAIITSMTGLFSLLIFFTPNSLAWVQTQRPGSNGTLISLAWDTSCYYYSIYEDGSDEIDLISLQELIRDSFGEWQDVPCSYFAFVETEFTKVDEIGFNSDRGNVNLIIWRELESEWPTSSGAVALTTTSYNKVNGVILDSDIEFNGAYFQFGYQDSYPQDTELMDLQSVVTHEIGHSIGLDHSVSSDATMDPSCSPGETEKSSLEQDDMDGACAIYPLADDPNSCEEPICGLDLTGDSTHCVGAPMSESCDCSAPGVNLKQTLNLLRLL